MTWKASVVEDFPTMSVRVHIADVRQQSSDHIVSLSDTTELRTVQEAAVGPPGMRLPREAAEPLRDALDAFLGKPRDDYRSRYEEARDALEVERRRVDSLLARNESA